MMTNIIISFTIYIYSQIIISIFITVKVIILHNFTLSIQHILFFSNTYEVQNSKYVLKQVLNYGYLTWLINSLPHIMCTIFF